jgi:hypothetical protein
MMMMTTTTTTAVMLVTEFIREYISQYRGQKEILLVSVGHQVQQRTHNILEIF